MLSRFRAAIRDKVARRLGLPEIPVAMERLAGQGFQPELIFDVGAYVGHFARVCRETWPEARVVCFEPQEHAAHQLRALQEADGQIEVYSCLLGAGEREAVGFHEGETASSVLAEHTEQADHFRMVEHPMTTVDHVVEADFDGRAPGLLKLDVQGYELEILKGAERSLPGVAAVLAEVNFLDIHVGVPLLADLTAWLGERGFVAFDICGITRRPLDDALWQADMVFVPETSPLRSDKRWGE